MADGRVQFKTQLDALRFAAACERMIGRLHLLAVFFGFYAWRRRGVGG